MYGCDISDSVKSRFSDTPGRLKSVSGASARDEDGPPEPVPILETLRGWAKENSSLIQLVILLLTVLTFARGR